MNYIVCSRCGKRVSNKAAIDLVVQAYVECTECIKKGGNVDTSKLIFEIVDECHGILLRTSVIQLMTMKYTVPMKWILSQGTIFRIIEEEA